MIIVFSGASIVAAAHSICSLKYKTHNDIFVGFHNGSNYSCKFIIKELAKEFKELFEWLGGNTEKYITILVSTEKEIKLGNKKNGEKIDKEIIDWLKLIVRFTQDWLSDLVDNPAEDFKM